MKKITFIAVSLAAAVGMAAAGPDDEEQAAKKFHEWSGSRTIPVHRIRLFDENAERIAPEYRQSMPYSSRATCGACHDYNAISRGWHFNYAQKDAIKGRAGQPWIWYDEVAGMQLPIAGRGWTNTWKAADAGLTPWKFIKTFGRNLPGGGPGEADDLSDDMDARWELSGKLEVDCLACHNGSAMQDHSEWVKQVARENFRWAATAAAGFGEVGGMASRMPSSWSVLQGQNPDDNQYAIAPNVRYDTRQFDRKGRTLIDIAIKPKDQNCLFCHSNAQDGRKKKDFDVDIHTRAGMNCADCHRNGINHMVTRNYETEAEQRGDVSVAGSSCRGCHLGVKGAGGVAAMGGRLGSPYPKHKGLPPVHFEKLACTTCHSGPWPTDNLVRVRTARANRIGITGVANWVTDLPYIVEPVFMKGEDGKIAPHRMVWPAFWARQEGDVLRPIAPEAVTNAAGDILSCEKKVAEILNALTPTNDLVPVFVVSGKVLCANADNGLDVYSGRVKGSTEGLAWALAGNGILSPVVPSSLPTADQQDKMQEVSERIKGVLTAFSGPVFRSRGKPLITIGDGLFRMNDASGDSEFLTFSDFNTEAKIDFSKLVKSVQPGQVPSLWWLKDGKVEAAMLPDYVVKSVGETAGTSFTFTEQQVAMVLKTLAGEEKGGKAKFVYVCSGKLFSLDGAGKLVASDHAAAQPATWPLAHEVRPATQALGAKKCTDCHSVSSPFFFGKVAASGPMKTASVQVKQMYELQEQDATFQRLFGLSFLVRSMFKTVMFGAGCLIAAVLLLYGILALNRVTKFLGNQ